MSMYEELEEWKDVVGYETLYKVSSAGRVWSKKDDKEVSQVKTGIPQYFYVNLVPPYVGGKRSLQRVHRLMALAFIPNPDNLKYVDHRNKNSFDNRLSNLRWVTRKQNQNNTKANKLVVEDNTEYPLVEWLETLGIYTKPIYGYVFRQLYGKTVKSRLAEEVLECIRIRFSKTLFY